MFNASPRGFARLAFTLLATLALASCGGGGGGSGSSSSGGSGNRGAFTIGATSASFKALVNEPEPAEVRIPVTITGSGVAAVGAAFVGQAQPVWLGVNLEGTNPNFTLVLRATTTTLVAAMRHTSTVTIGTADSAGTVLKTRTVDVTYDLIAGLIVSQAPQNTSFVFGSSVNTATFNIDVQAQSPTKTWTVTSSQPWVTAPAGTQTGNANLSFTVNGANTGTLPVGTATAQLTFQNTAEALDRKVVTVNATITAPSPIVVATAPSTFVNPLRIGGTSGLGPLSQLLDVSIPTGTNVYPWTLTIDTPQTAGWLVSDASAGNISGTQHDELNLSLETPIGAAGNYTANAHFDVAVLGQTFRTTVPITLKWHGQRLVPAQNGIAFSSFPSRPTPAAQTLRVAGSRGINGVPWTASSNQAWLTVTPAGVTGGNITLTPDPAGLANNALHIATITLSSTSPNIERNETIRVGYWKGSTNPGNLRVAIPSFPPTQAVNPVEPYAYIFYGDAVHVFHVYTGAEIATFNNPGYAGGTGVPVSLDVSSDGKVLYLAHGGNSRVIAVDAATGAQIDVWQLQPRFTSPLDSKVRFSRTNGYPILWTPFGDLSTQIIDLEAGAPVQLTTEGILLFREFENERTTSPDGSRLFTIAGGSTSNSVNQFSTVFGTFGGRTLEINTQPGFGLTSADFTRTMCVNPSGTRLYSTNSAALNESAIDVTPPVHLREVPRDDFPGTSVQGINCNPNGRTYVAVTAFEGDLDNVMVLDANGDPIGHFLAGPLNSGIIIGMFNTTGDARRMVTTNVEVAEPPLISINFTNVP
jgi:hypothetical protein